MPRAFRLECDTIDEEEAQRRIRRELALERLPRTKAPRLLKTIDVVEAMCARGFAPTGNLRDGTLVFEDEASSVLVRRDWGYAGVAYLAACDGRSLGGRRITTPRQLARAVAALRFRRNAWRRLECAKALHDRLGRDAAISVLGLDALRMCLGWVG